MILYIESREPQAIKEKITEFFELKGIQTVLQEFPEGNFKYGNIILESKKINDYVSSIKN